VGSPWKTATAANRFTIHGVLVYAGIDEAGYGPMLGPLCVACTAFVVADHDPDAAGACDMWKRLKSAVCRKKTDKRRRIAVDDSKKLKNANDCATHPLRHLERGVLAFAAGESWSCDSDLFKALAIPIPPNTWYGSTTPLPVAQTTNELGIAAARLRTAMAAQSTSCELMRCEAIDAELFNRQVDLMGSKASVNFCAVMRHIDAIWKRWPNDHPRVIVDRQGGRTHYLRDLLHAWPEANAQVLAETDTLSRYRLEKSGSLITISFQVEAEAAHLPVALASMTAKYVRELLMLRLNRYFRSHMPELKPTAGYVEDGRRYIGDIEPLIARLGVDRRSLIRSV
jgi:ribonuclease HII